MVEVERLAEIQPAPAEMEPARLELLALIPSHGNLSSQDIEGLEGLSVQKLVDTLVMQLPIPAELRQALHSELRVDRRLDALVELLRPEYRRPNWPDDEIGPYDVRRN